MEKLNLKNFLIRYNFRKAPNEYENADFLSETIRIYIDDENEDNWFEFGVYNYDSLEEKIKRLDSALNKELLDRQVTLVEYNEDIEKICVVLGEE